MMRIRRSREIKPNRIEIATLEGASRMNSLLST